MAKDAVINPERQQEDAPELEVLTWGYVKKRFFEYLKLENKERQKRNFKTAIKFFLEAISLTEESPVGTELTEEFETKVELYISFQRNRKVSESTYKPRVSKIRALKIFVVQNFASILHVQTLPKPFGKRLRSLICALGLTIKTFWHTLPTGLVGYASLVNWCGGKQLPSVKFLHVIEKLEMYLGVPPGTLRLPRYLLKGLNLRIGQSDSGNKARAVISKPYGIWTESLQQEYQGLFLNKTIAILPEGEERSEEGQWTINEGGEIPSAKLAMKTLKSFMGFCALPQDCPDPYLRGAGINIEDLSLALLADKKLVENYLNFMKLRSGLRVKPVDNPTVAALPAHMISPNGRWEFYDKGGKYNGGSIRVLSFVSSLLRPGTGYLYQHPEYSEKLGKLMTAETWQEQCKVTRKRVKLLLRSILLMKKNNDGKNFEFGRDPKALIQWILDLPRPLLLLQEVIKEMLDDLLPENAPQVIRAKQYRDLVLFALLCANPLRIVMFSYMKFDENLVRRNDGSWEIKFPQKAFKNRRSLSSNYHVHVAKELWPILDRYKEEFHPILAGSSASKYVFISRGRGRQTKQDGSPMCELSLSGIIHALTELYLPDSIGFRPHAFRHIIATDFIRKDPRFGFYLASKALHDKLETVERDYVDLKSSEYFEPVNTHFSEAWSVVFQPFPIESTPKNVMLETK